MGDYSFWTGLWKTIKNWVVISVPAFTAGWVAFVSELPADQQIYFTALAGFVSYFLKNLVEVKMTE